jgi:hypothetical protein
MSASKRTYAIYRARYLVFVLGIWSHPLFAETLTYYVPNATETYVNWRVNIVGGAGMPTGSYIIPFSGGGGASNFNATFHVTNGVVDTGSCFNAFANQSLSCSGEIRTSLWGVGSGTTWTYTPGAMTGPVSAQHDATAISWTRVDDPNPGANTHTSKVTTINVGTPPNQATFTGAIKANCATQHAFGLTINGVQVSYQVTSAFATKDAPSTVAISYSCNSNSIDCANGKPYIWAVDGVPVHSGNIVYNGGSFASTMTVSGIPHGVGSPLFFDCAPPSGVLSLSGSMSIPPGAQGTGHTLSAKLNGVTIASSASAPGGQSVSVSATKDNVANGDVLNWYVDGVLSGTHTVALDCAHNAEFNITTCSDSATFTGVATGGTPTPPPPTPTAPPSPTVPPQPNYTPPVPPTYTPPGPGPTIGGSNGGDVRVMNPQDIYTPIVNSLTLTNAGTVSRDNSISATGVTFGRGHLDELQSQTDKALATQDQIRDKGTTLTAPLKTGFEGMPTTLGSVTTLNLGLGSFNNITTRGAFTTLPASVNLTPYMSGIQLGRLVQLWALTIFFAFLTVRAFTWTQ